MPEIFVGEVAVGVVPDARGFHDRIRADLVPSANQIGQEIGREITKGVTSQFGVGKIVSDSAARSRADLDRAGDSSGGAFGDAFRKRLEAAMKALPKINLGADATEADVQLAKIRAEMERLSKQQIGVDMSGKEAMAQLDILDKELGRLQSKAKDIDVNFNISKALGEIAVLRREMDKASGGDGGIFARIGRNLGGAGGGGGGVAGILPGATGLVNPYTITAAAAALPFAGQALAGGVTSLFGGGLAALGIAGALQGITSAQVSTQQLAAAHDKLNAAQLRVIAAQDRLNKLQDSGKATAAQLASAQGSVASAQAGLITAQQNYSKLQKQSADSTIAGHQRMAQSFHKLSGDAQSSLSRIGVAFVPVMTSIFNTADSYLKKMTPVFAGAEHTIAGPFQNFADTLINSFTSPTVQSSIHAVANAFVAILNALSPQLGGDINALALGVERVANAIGRNPRAFADFISFLIRAAGFALSMIAALTSVASYIEIHFLPAIHDIERIFDEVRHWIASNFGHQIASDFDHIRHDVSHIWDILWNNTIGTVVHAHQAIQNDLRILEHDVAHWFDLARHDVAAAWDALWSNTVGRLMRGVADSQRITAGFEHWIAAEYDQIRHDISSTWDLIWNNTVGRVERGISDTVNWFKGMPGRIVNGMGSLRGTLLSAGDDLIQGLMNGIVSRMRGIGSWIKASVVDPVVNAVKHFFGIRSPSTLFAGIGFNLVAGLLLGMARLGGGAIARLVFGDMPSALMSIVGKGLINLAGLPAKALDLLGSLGSKLSGVGKSIWHSIFGGGGGGGVAQWAGIILEALRLLGQSPAWLPVVERRMNQESGGNNTIVNKWDSNWIAGHPSVGLMQVIGPTFKAYAGPFRGVGPFEYGVSVNPLANTFAGLNYALHTYGSLAALNRPGGYDLGGWLPTGASMVYNYTGQPEAVLNARQWDAISTLAVGGDGVSTVAELRALRKDIKALTAVAAHQGDDFAVALSDTTRRSASRSAR